VYYTVEKHAWMLQKNNGVARIGLDGTLYDQVLDATFILGLAPSRFQVPVAECASTSAQSPPGLALLATHVLVTTHHCALPPRCCVLRLATLCSPIQLLMLASDCATCRRMG
jgi:hypothetical protein